MASKRLQGRNSDPLSNLSKRSPRVTSPLASPSIEQRSSAPRARSESPMDRFNQSPASGSSPVSSEQDTDPIDISNVSSQKKSKRQKKSNCPCGKSSDGQEWILTCPDCTVTRLGTLHVVDLKLTSQSLY